MLTDKMSIKLIVRLELLAAVLLRALELPDSQMLIQDVVVTFFVVLAWLAAMSAIE